MLYYLPKTFTIKYWISQICESWSIALQLTIFHAIDCVGHIYDTFRITRNLWKRNSYLFLYLDYYEVLLLKWLKFVLKCPVVSHVQSMCKVLIHSVVCGIHCCLYVVIGSEIVNFVGFSILGLQSESCVRVQ